MRSVGKVNGVNFKRRTRTCCTLAAVLAALPAATEPARAGDVRLWPSAAASGTETRLADVASLSGFDAAQAVRLSELVVSVRSDGGPRTLKIEDLRGVLESAGVNWAEVRLVGATQCEISTGPAPDDAKAQRSAAATRAARRSARSAIRPAGHRGAADRVEFLATTEERPAANLRQPGRGGSRPGNLANALPERSAARRPGRPGESRGARTLEQAVRDAIDADLSDLGGQIDVRFGAAAAGALSLSEPECRFRVRPRACGESRLGMRWFDVEVTRGDGRTQTIPIMAEATLLRPVVVAARVVNSGQDVTARDVRIEARPFQRIEDVGQTDLSAVIGMEARRALRPGDMLKPQDIRNKPLVRRNQLVTIWSRAGGVMVQSSGRATRDGWLGDELEIRSEGSDEHFFAAVTGPATVSLDERAAGQVAQR